ncbi:MAG: ATP-binding protein [Deltaproteobacteria bacterium]|nr:ATP-binding protein [Deltaproteobacteria bacterium]
MDDLKVLPVKKKKDEIFATPSLILNNLPHALIIIDKDLTIIMANSAVEKLLGYCEEELKGKGFGDIVHDSSINSADFMDKLISGVALNNYPIACIKKNGKKIAIDFNGSSMRDGEGGLIGMILIMNEMRSIDQLTYKLECALKESEEKSKQIAYLYNNVEIANLELEEKNRALNESRNELEIKVKERTKDLEKTKDDIEVAYKELQQAQFQLLQSEKMACVGQLAAGVAHEINNPIAFINSNLGSLREYLSDMKGFIEKIESILPVAEKSAHSELSAQAKEIVDFKGKVNFDFIMADLSNIIEESIDGTNRVREIVENLKEFSHIDEAKLIFADINKGIESTLNIVKNEIKYVATVRKELGEIPRIRCYPQQLNQVFMNLLVNAAQAIENEGEIAIRTTTKGESVFVEISDTGQGIAEEKMGKIFEPFFTTKPVGVGTGLGLSMSFNIIKNHGGNISVKSEVGKGTTFTVELPIEGVKAGKQAVCEGG